MGTLDLKYTRVSVDPKHSHNALSKSDFAKFNASILGLGNLTKDAKIINALAAVFDLEGFTIFCSQIDPQLVIPEYLNGFLPWLFKEVAARYTRETREDQQLLWGSLPFFAKFMGDGVLFLWNTDLSHDLTGIGNDVICVHDVANKYKTDFLPTVSRAHSNVPRRLRVGLARGQVFSVGDGNDFVGPCINMASRLQKLGALPFAFSRRGFDPEKCFGEAIRKKLVTLTTQVRGVGEDERIVVFKEDYDSLTPREKKLFKMVEPKG